LESTLYKRFVHTIETLGPWPKLPILGVAVSGGPDSLALLLLAHQWAQEQGGKAICLHVDHRLRSTSPEEATQLQAFCQQHNIPCHILVWNHGAISHNIQEKARNARYSLLLKQCATLGVLHLLTAHHQNDQQETIHMRALHKSGPRGLAGIQPITWSPAARILRPLLEYTKEDLLEVVQNLPYLQDPSNLNDQFARVRIRKELASQSPVLMQQGIADHQKAQGQRTQSEQEAWQYLANHAVSHPQGFASLNNPHPFKPPLMALAFLLQYVRGKSYLPDQPALATLEATLSENPSKAFTIHTCTVWISQGKWLFAREYRKPLRTPIRSSESFYWDNRFLVDLIPQNPLYLGLELGMLGKNGWQQVLAQGPVNTSLPWRVLECLPAFWLKDRVIGVPHLGINLTPNVCKDPLPRLRFMAHYDMLRFETTEKE
jgi:tRNA(Ile)-lysidine synthase